MQSDFEIIQSALLCLKSIYGESTLDFQVEVNNLGGQETLKMYNKAVVDVLVTRRQELSAVSKQRLDAGHAVRILESKS